MTISTHPQVRKSLVACIIALAVAVTGCQQPTPSPRPLSAEEVKTLSAGIAKVSSAYIDAWNKHDTDLMGVLMTDDIAYYESENSPMLYFKENMVSLNKMVLDESPDFGGRQVETFIGREDGFDIWEMWNWSGSTRESPYLAYDRYVLKDGKISAMYLFWGSEVFERLWTPGSTFDSQPLQDYASAWSSGNPETVAGLYDTKSVRQDSIFNEKQQGVSAVKEFAASFFTWYAGIRLEVLQTFKLGNSYPAVLGGVYAIHLTDQAGKPCAVRAIILLEAYPEKKIINELLFYNGESLITCGWAQ